MAHTPRSIPVKVTLNHEALTKDLGALLAERDDLRRQVEAVLALHVDKGNGFCRECDYSMPCPSKRATEVDQ